MNIAFVPEGTHPFRDTHKSLGPTVSPLACQALMLAGDITLVIDSNDMICDVSLGGPAISEGWVDELIGKRWSDTVSVESRSKIETLCHDVRSGEGKPRWRQVNHSSALGDLPVRYTTLGADQQGHIVAIGRDMRSEAVLQQRLLQSQQAVERDYVKMRQVEARYRQLFDLSTEAVLVADASTRRILEANPAACHLLGSNAKSLMGQPIANLFDSAVRDKIIALLGSVGAAEQRQPVALRLAQDAGDVMVAASLFRQDRGSCFLIRLVPHGAMAVQFDQVQRPLINVIDSMPDALVVTDENLLILSNNSAFLDMVQLARKEQVNGQPLSRFLGRPGIDLNLLMTELRDYGTARNFATVLRSVYDGQEDVEASAVSVQDEGVIRYGFSIRSVGRKLASLSPAAAGLPRSVEQLTELVGRVALKDIVRESTDLIERLCIEAALVYTSDNRASAAEVLGLSRQSLYSKLHRHGLGNLGEAETAR